MCDCSPSGPGMFYCLCYITGVSCYTFYLDDDPPTPLKSLVCVEVDGDCEGDGRTGNRGTDGVLFIGGLSERGWDRLWFGSWLYVWNQSRPPPHVMCSI